MKKTIHFSPVAMFFTTLSYGQAGIQLDYSVGKAKTSVPGLFSVETSAEAFGMGLVYDYKISPGFDLQPGIGFGIGEKTEGRSNNSIGLSANLQYYLLGREKGFLLSTGLGYSASLADIDTDIVRRGALSIGFGLGTIYPEGSPWSGDMLHNLTTLQKCRV